ncbi:MAG: hypothetical protein WAM75_21650 [Xanthobacteraceae bacterium]
MTKLSDYNARAVGIAWIREEDYTACRAIFEDGDKFFSTWEKWVESANKSEAEFKSQGYIVERAYIDPDTFADWCRINTVTCGREGRTKFAADFIAKKYSRNQS